MKVEELYIYPLKSARAQNVPQMKISSLGPEGDRQWMLIDEDGNFLSQRTLPKLATIEVHDAPDALTVGLGNMFFKISKNNSWQRRVPVKIWNEVIEAALEPDLYSQGLSQYLGKTVRLVRYAPFSQRRVNSVTEGWQPEVRFTDGRPLLLMNQKSLQELNSRLAEPVPMDRFRPNIVISGASAYEEDVWTRIKIGEVVFSQPKKSARCVIINLDQKTGENRGPEPLKTLSSYRREGSKVVFGTLWIPENEGLIRQQDPVEIL